MIYLAAGRLGALIDLQDRAMPIKQYLLAIKEWDFKCYDTGSTNLSIYLLPTKMLLRQTHPWCSRDNWQNGVLQVVVAWEVDQSRKA